MSELLVNYQNTYGVDNPSGETDGEWRFLKSVDDGGTWDVVMTGSIRKILRKMMRVVGIPIQPQTDMDVDTDNDEFI